MGYTPIAERIAQMERYLPALTRRPDFDAFWAESIAQAKAQPLRLQTTLIPYPASAAEVYDITYCGFDETPVHGWLVLPRRRTDDSPIPCVISYHGYSGSRGYPSQWMPWVMMDMAVLSIDCREQGGLTGSAVPSHAGIVSNISTKGLLDKSAYYYRAVYMDCLKAIDAALACPIIDPARILIRGASQGGALAVATAALDSRPMAAFAHVPSNSNIERRVECASGSFASVNQYLRRYPDHVESAYETLSYFDTMNMADRIRCPLFATVSMADATCPPECFYATYNRIGAPKQIRVYPFNDHTDGSAAQLEQELLWMQAALEM